MDCID
ncbi:hypothetical protein EE612_058158 [Oryza sativa]